MAGTARAAVRGAVAFESEDSFADAADNTITSRLQVRQAMIDVSGLDRPFVPAGGVKARLNEADLHRLGAYGFKTFTLEFDLEGHGSATTGSLTRTDLGLLLGHAVGNSDFSAVGDTSLTTAGSTTTSFAGFGGTALVGGIARVGVRGDARGGGQAVVTSNNADPLTSLVAIAAAPNTGDDLQAMGMIYPVSAGTTRLTSSGAATNNTLRFLLYTANQVYVCRGCACTGLQFTGLSPGEMPRVVTTWSTVFAEPLGSVTFPPTEATDAKTPAPTANGSVFINDVGTTTRVTDTTLAIELAIGQGMSPVIGQEGENDGQSVVGWERVPAETTLTLTFESPAQSATPSYQITTNPSTARHILITGSVVDGSAYAFYFPRCIQMGQPQQVDVGGLNGWRVQFLCATGATTTSELTLSAWRLGQG